MFKNQFSKCLGLVRAMCHKYNDCPEPNCLQNFIPIYLIVHHSGKNVILDLWGLVEPIDDGMTKIYPMPSNVSSVFIGVVEVSVELLDEWNVSH